MLTVSVAMTVCGWLCIIAAGFALLSALRRNATRSAIFGLLAAIAFGGWLYSKSKIDAARTAAPPPTEVAAPVSAGPTAPEMPADAGPAVATPPELSWCRESPTENCLLAACLASARDGIPTFVLMSAEWCPACQVMAIHIRYADTPRSTLSRYRLVYLDLDANPEMSNGFPNRSIPAGFVIGNSCEVAAMYEGTDALRNFFKYPPDISRP